LALLLKKNKNFDGRGKKCPVIADKIFNLIPKRNQRFLLFWATCRKSKMVLFEFEPKKNKQTLQTNHRIFN
jgi:hypothetical protein